MSLNHLTSKNDEQKIIATRKMLLECGLRIATVKEVKAEQNKLGVAYLNPLKILKFGRYTAYIFDSGTWNWYRGTEEISSDSKVSLTEILDDNHLSDEEKSVLLFNLDVLNQTKEEE